MSNRPGQGRPPKPSTIRDRNERDAHLETPNKVPPPPRDFTADEREAWWRTGWELIQARLITQVDKDVLAQYCRAWCRSVEANRRLQMEPWVVSTVTGGQKKHPLFDIIKDANGEIDRLARELGMTPAARVRLPKRKGEGGPRASGDSAAQRSGTVPGGDPRKLRAVK